MPNFALQIKKLLVGSEMEKTAFIYSTFLVFKIVINVCNSGTLYIFHIRTKRVTTFEVEGI